MFFGPLKGQLGFGSWMLEGGVFGVGGAVAFCFQKSGLFHEKKERLKGVKLH